MDKIKVKIKIKATVQEYVWMLWFKSKLCA
jgi:hypothetical protein